MCGIVGQLSLVDSIRPAPPSVYDEALSRLHHRGPDAHGQWRSDDGRCWLGHTRLSIVDLAHGHQPMLTPEGRIAVSYNGEVYNFPALRDELLVRGYSFRTRCDTEVLLHGYSAWGGPALCERLQGIFAFAIYDTQTSSLFLGRDHFGVKPLYWWSNGSQFLFASEIKALLAFPTVQASREVNLRGVAQTVVARCVARPETMFKGIWRLPEGSYLQVVPGRAMPSPVRYWDSRFASEVIDPAEALAELEHRLQDVIEQQLMSDVPVGVQLSGGIDSSLVTAMMVRLQQRRGSRVPVKSFSVGFPEAQYSELKYARMVAERYGTEHHELTLHPDRLLHSMVLGAWHYDEPMGEPCAVPTYLMCEMARRQGITVMLTGEGADEIFGGYSKYSQEIVAGRLESASGGLLNRGIGLVSPLLPASRAKARRALDVAAIPSEALRIASWYGGFNAREQRELLSTQMQSRVGDGGLRAAFEQVLEEAPATGRLARFMYTDRHARLVDHILVKGDRMSMAAGVEARVPFLDWSLADFADRLPATLKVHGNRRKYLLSTLAEKYLPPAVIHRPKVGFAIPVKEWLRGPLSGLVRETVLSERSLSRGYFNADYLALLVNSHLEGRANHDAALWQLTALELWHRLYADDDGSRAAVTRVCADLGLPADPGQPGVSEPSMSSPLPTSHPAYA